MKYLTPLGVRLFSSQPNLVPGVYRHYSGRMYTVEGLIWNAESQESCVLYRPLYPSPHSAFVRPQEAFFQTVKLLDREKVVPRFELLYENFKGASHRS